MYLEDLRQYPQTASSPISTDELIEFMRDTEPDWYRGPGLKALVFWTLSGVIHFALGRTWAYRSIQFIGSNRSNVVTSLNPVVTIILALVILHEEVNELMGMRIIFSLAVPLVILLKEKTLNIKSPHPGMIQGKDVDRLILYKGFFYGVGAGPVTQVSRSGIHISHSRQFPESNRSCLDIDSQHPFYPKV